MFDFLETADIGEDGAEDDVVGLVGKLLTAVDHGQGEEGDQTMLN